MRIIARSNLEWYILYILQILPLGIIENDAIIVYIILYIIVCIVIEILH